MPRRSRRKECEMFSRTSALTRVRGTRSNRSPNCPASSPRCRNTIFFLETLVNISVKGAAGELAEPANRNRPDLALSKNYSQDTLGRTGAKRASRRVVSLGARGEDKYTHRPRIPALGLPFFSPSLSRCPRPGARGRT